MMLLLQVQTAAERLAAAQAESSKAISASLEGVAAGRPRGALAAAFHETIVEVTRELVAAAAAETDLRTVCLSGGVFQNVLLRELLVPRLEAQLAQCAAGQFQFPDAEIAAAIRGERQPHVGAAQDAGHVGDVGRVVPVALEADLVFVGGGAEGGKILLQVRAAVAVAQAGLRLIPKKMPSASSRYSAVPRIVGRRYRGS